MATKSPLDLTENIDQIADELEAVLSRYIDALLLIEEDEDEIERDRIISLIELALDDLGTARNIMSFWYGHG